MVRTLGEPPVPESPRPVKHVKGHWSQYPAICKFKANLLLSQKIILLSLFFVWFAGSPCFVPPARISMCLLLKGFRNCCHQKSEMNVCCQVSFAILTFCQMHSKIMLTTMYWWFGGWRQVIFVTINFANRQQKPQIPRGWIKPAFTAPNMYTHSRLVMRRRRREMNTV